MVMSLTKNTLWDYEGLDHEVTRTFFVIMTCFLRTVFHVVFLVRSHCLHRQNGEDEGG